MKLLFYSSPYDYYADNLRPLVREAMESGDEVYGSFSYEMTDNPKKFKESPYTSLSDTPMRDFLTNKLKPDAVILVQPWWYGDRLAAQHAVNKKIPFYIVDHAPPMFRYTESNGKKSHLYRANLMGAKAFFAYGKETLSIMSKVGCGEKMTAIGSPRIEDMLEQVNIHKPEKNIVIFDTSHRMEDEKVAEMTAILSKDLADKTGVKVYLREHSRSPKLIRKTFKKHKLGEYTLVNSWSEAEIAAKSEIFLFTLPSSAMLLPALLDKKIVGTYGNHFSAAAKVYSHRYREDIFIFKGKVQSLERYLKEDPTYHRFLGQNLKRYTEKTTASKAILAHIRGNS